MRWRNVWACLCLAAAIGLTSSIARAETKAEENIVFDFADISDTHPNALKLVKDMVEGRRKVRKWWGATFEDTIRVSVSEEHRIQTSLVPAWKGNRGHFLVNTRRVTNYAVTTIHNLIHIYAPNGNRLLAEGLAVYAHNHLKGPPGRPDYGEDLHKLAAPLLETFDLVRIDRRYRTPRPLPRPQEEAYIVAGSFVKFLIETFGMGKFRELYAASPFTPGERVFGLEVRDYLKVTAPHEGWDDVTFGDVLSMATGIGDRYPQPSPNKMFIDGGNPNDRRYREAKAAEDKLKAILSYGNYPWGPGKVVRYISNQTFLLSAAMDSFLKSREGPKANIWTMLRDEVYRPIGIHYPFIWRTVETGGKPGIPLIAAGMILTLEDAAKIAMLLRDGGVHKGKQLLSKSKIDEALFRIPGLGLDRGTKSGCEAGRYHMSFYLDGSETIRPGCHARGVYASGWGGNQIVFTDNGVVALRFADAFQNSVTPLLRAADLVKPLR